MTDQLVDEPIPHHNMVHLVGRLSRTPVVRTMPSGDRLTTWRLVVRRDRTARKDSQASGGKGAAIDVIECGTWLPELGEHVVGFQPGDHLEVHGWLRRRFWKSRGGQLGNRHEVEVHSARRVEPSPVGSDDQAEGMPT